jgi:hypothetical protein
MLFQWKDKKMTAPKRKPRTLNQPAIEDVFPTQPQMTAPPQYAALPAPAPAYDDDEQFDDYDDVTALNTLLGEIGADGSDGGAFITVYKGFAVNGVKSEKYMGRYAVADFASGTLLEHIKNTFGGGKYHIRVYNPGGKGLVANKQIDIEGDAVVAPVVTSTPAVDLSPVLQGMAQMQSNFEKLMGALIQSQQKPASRIEMFEEMRIMRELFSPANVPQNNVPAPVHDPLALIKLGVELAGNKTGEENDNSWVNRVIDTLGAPVMEMITKNMAKPQSPAQPARQALPHTAQNPAASASGATQPTEDDPMNLMMRGYLLMVTNAAKASQDTAEFADSILGMLPETQLAEFEAMLRAPDWREKFATYSPAVNTYPEWFTRLHDNLLQFIDEDKGLTVDDTGASVTAHETIPAPEKSPDGDAGITS